MADIRVDMVSNMEVDKVADKEMVDMELDMVADIDINMEIQFGERGGHKGWLIGPKLFQPEAYPDCASSKALRVYFGRSLAITFT